MSRRAGLGAALVSSLALAAVGCPRLPPPPPRPAVFVVSVERAAATGDGEVLRARLDVHNRGAFRLVLAAIDWEMVDPRGDRAISRGRAATHRVFAPDQRAVVDIDLAIPAPVAEQIRRAAAAAGSRIRLRGTAHLEDPAGGEGAAAPFDDPAPLR